MRVLIVDDEAPARARLRRLLEQHADVEVAGEARDGAEGLERVAELAPDAVFLDVQMPGVGGLDVAASLADPAPAVVFVTAFDQYAIPAFDAAALDYLLKPVEPERLAKALERIRTRGAHTAAERRAPAHAPPGQLLIPDRGRTHVVPVAEIHWLEAADNYVAVHAGARAPLMRRTLAALLDDLGSGFVRTHRGAAVALAHVSRLETRERGDATVVLRDGSQVPCSRQYRATLVARLGGTRT
jgi:two-component system LytT family response regulator